LKTPRSVRRFLIIFAVAFIVIAGAHLLRGRPLEYAALHGLIWSVISALVFVAAQIHKDRKLQRCAVCEAIDGPPPATGR
jgi:hypothetical protein